ncbi:MAG: ATP-binding protein [Acidimicrobiales bacterium]
MSTVGKFCRVCRGAPVIELRQHNASFCEEHFLKFCRDQVERTIHKFRMFEPEARVLVAVSGGKDSLALWDILHGLGYATEGLVITLGIGEYSTESTAAAHKFAADRGLTLREYDLAGEHGFTVPDAAGKSGRAPCSACGMSKRHVFDKVATENGFDVVVTGHNLDDEAAVLFGNVVRWEADYLARQMPVLEAHDGFPRKAKPLVRLGEREMAAYCVLRGIDYIVEECPMAAGNKHLAYKDILNDLEATSPGAKSAFYFGFLDRAAAVFAAAQSGEAATLGACVRCGSPSNAEVCAFCRLAERAAPVTFIPRSGDG